MKKNTIIALGVLTAMSFSCKKEDTIQPVITLNGNIEQSVALNGTYSEAGATAMDNEDGDISDKVVISGTVNTNLKGEYRKYYDVQDSEGNKAATATRYVQVVNESDYMIGTYQATPTCSGTSTFNTYNTTVTVSEEVNNQIYIKRVMWLVEDDPVIAEINGNVIDIPAQTVGSNTVSGTATISGSDFLLNVSINGSSSYTCSIDHIKL
ncbi:MAG: DUF5011 domain-containing protein [Crocinitomicaceae bacterium]|nr:DUF5011 domain-containing protein [Crocinitomicaceae bacterium]